MCPQLQYHPTTLWKSQFFLIIWKFIMNQEKSRNFLWRNSHLKKCGHIIPPPTILVGLTESKVKLAKFNPIDSGEGWFHLCNSPEACTLNISLHRYFLTFPVIYFNPIFIYFYMTYLNRVNIPTGLSTSKMQSIHFQIILKLLICKFNIF